MSFYQGKHRQNLEDNTDIDTLENARQEAENPKPDEVEIPVEVAAVAPDPEELPQPENVEEQTFKKRYSDLRRHMAAKEREWQQKFDALMARVEEVSKTTLELPKEQDEVAAWMQQYPDVARIVTKIAETQAEKQTVDFKKQLESLEQARRQTAREKAEFNLRKAHEDIDTLRNSEDFHEWVTKQPKLIQDALYYNELDWQAAARAIDLYKADKAKLEAPKQRGRPRKEDVEASAPVTVKNQVDPSSAPTKKMYKESEISRMHWRDYDAQEADIMAARREGRIIYDLSQKMASM